MNRISLLKVAIPVCVIAGLFVSVWEDNLHVREWDEVNSSPAIKFEDIPSSKDELVTKELIAMRDQLEQENAKLREKVSALSVTLDDLIAEVKLRQRYSEQFEDQGQKVVEFAAHNDMLNGYGQVMAASVLEGLGEAIATTNYHRRIKGERWYELPSATYEKFN